jgi:parallel beta-helix repeat protein
MGQEPNSNAGPPGFDWSTWPLSLVDACDPTEDIEDALFVSPTGGDTGAGTKEDPMSLREGLKALEPGGTLYLLGGTYAYCNGPEQPWDRGVWVRPNQSGTAEQPTRVKAYQCQKAIIDCGAPDAQEVTAAAVGIEARHFVLEDLEVARSPVHGVCIYTEHVTLRRNIVRGHKGTGICRAEHRNLPPPAHVLIEGNQIFDNARHVVETPNLKGGWANGIGAGSPYTVVRANISHHNYGEGIVAGGEGPVTIEDNLVYDNRAAGIYVCNAQKTRVERNFVYFTGDSEFLMKGFVPPMPPGGIQVASENENGEEPPSNGVIIVNNIVLGGRNGFGSLDYQTGGGLQNALVAGNTFYGSSSELLVIKPSRQNLNSSVRNNIFYQTGTTPLVEVKDPGGVTFSHNLFYGGDGTSGGAAGDGDLSEDPLLADLDALSPPAYRPLAGSVVIGAGAAGIAELVEDFARAPRRAPPAIGAFEP